MEQLLGHWWELPWWLCSDMRAFSDSRLKALKLKTTNFKVATNKDSITGNWIIKCQHNLHNSQLQTDIFHRLQILILLTLPARRQYHQKCIESVEASTVTTSACSVVTRVLTLQRALSISKPTWIQPDAQWAHTSVYLAASAEGVCMSKRSVRGKAAAEGHIWAQNSIIINYIWTPAGLIMRVNMST